MKKMTTKSMRITNGGYHTVNGRFNAYHCFSCWSLAFTTGLGAVFASPFGRW